LAAHNILLAVQATAQQVLCTVRLAPAIVPRRLTTALQVQNTVLHPQHTAQPAQAMQVRAQHTALICLPIHLALNIHHHRQTTVRQVPNTAQHLQATVHRVQLTALKVEPHILLAKQNILLHLPPTPQPALLMIQMKVSKQILWIAIHLMVVI
jgi:hypothetical protein